MWAVYKKELKTYFYSPLAYVLSGIFVLVFGIYFLTQTMSKVGQGIAQFCVWWTALFCKFLACHVDSHIDNESVC